MQDIKDIDSDKDIEDLEHLLDAEEAEEIADGVVETPSNDCE